MKVLELINALQTCSPDAKICVEANCDPAAYVVKEYHMPNGEILVYIADDTYWLDSVMPEGTVKFGGEQ